MKNNNKNKISHKNNSLSLENEKILGVKITITKEFQLLKVIENRLKNGLKTSIVTPNPEIVLEASKNSSFKEILNNSDVSIPDGKGIAWAIDHKFKKSIQIVRGREFVLKLLGICEAQNIPVLVLTGSSLVAKLTDKKLKIDYPKLQSESFLGPVIGYDGNPVSEVDSLIQIDIENHIKKFRKIVVVAAFGAIKQEKWLAKIAKNYNQVVATIGVGGAFDYYTNVTSKPPKIVASWGLEWLWRLIWDPRRLPRIIKALIIFPLTVYLKEK